MAYSAGRGSTSSGPLLRTLLTMPFNVSGHPVLATRAGFSASGLPLSFQLVARPFEEAGLLAAGHAHERATDWIGMRPKVLQAA